MNPKEAQSYSFVDTEAALHALTDRIGDADRVVVDTEADSLHHYYEKVCLIQLALQDDCYLVDPLAGLDMTRFIDALASKPLLLHGADYDLRMLQSSFGFRPQEPVFDTMLAAQLLGYESFGLAALVERFQGQPLSKSGQKSNWARRPLTDLQRLYASNDVRYLAALADQLAENLAQLGRTAWHEESCEAQVRATQQLTVLDPDDAWRIKGLGPLSRRQVAFVRELWHWRDKEAQEADRPSFKIIGNRPMIELACWANANPDRPLEEGPKLPRHIIGPRLTSLAEAIERANRLPEDEWPAPRKSHRHPRQNEDTRPTVDAIRLACSELAETLQIAPSVLAPRAAIQTIVRDRATQVEAVVESGALLRWQATLVAPLVAQVLGNPHAK